MSSRSSYSKMDEHGRPVKPVPKKADTQKTARIGKTLDNVTNTMKSNIVKATERDAKLKDLEDQTDKLEASGSSFYKTSGEVKKMFQWKAFLWQLGFACIILVILAAVTLYILSATGVLNSRGRSTPATTEVVPLTATTETTDATTNTVSSPSTTTDTANTDSNAALFTLHPGFIAYKQEEAKKKKQQQVVKEATNNDGCPEGEMKCTTALAEQNSCIIGRCFLPKDRAESTQSITESKTTGEVEESEPTQTVETPKTTVASPQNEPVPTAPLTGAGRVYKPENGEDPTQAENEIREALLTLHRHAADCSVDILHKDCTLDLLMQGWGVPAY